MIGILFGRALSDARQSNRTVNGERHCMHAAMHELVGTRFGQRTLRNLGGVIRGILRRTATRLRSEHEDNRAVATLGHPPDYCLRAKERTVAINFKLKVEVFFGNLREWLAQVSACIIDEHRDWS